MFWSLFRWQTKLFIDFLLSQRYKIIYQIQLINRCWTKYSATQQLKEYNTCDDITQSMEKAEKNTNFCEKFKQNNVSKMRTNSIIWMLNLTALKMRVWTTFIDQLSFRLNWFNWRMCWSKSSTNASK